MCACVSVYVQMHVGIQGDKKTLTPLELELQEAVSPLLWSSVKALCSLDC